MAAPTCTLPPTTLPAPRTIAPANLLADSIAAFGAANVAYVSHWAHLINIRQGDLFWMQSAPSPLRLIALICNTALLGAMVLLLIRASRGRGALAVAARVLLGVFAALCINSIRDFLAGFYPDSFGGNLLRSYTERQLLIAGVGAAAVLVVAARYLFSLLPAIMRPALIGIGCFGLLSVAKAVVAIHDFEPPAPASFASFLPVHSGTPRVIWVVFDELDYRLALVDRDPDLALPVLDRLRKSAVVASRAYPPSGATDASFLTFLLGERVRSFDPLSPDNLRLRTLEHRGGIEWKQSPNVFSEARQTGVNGAVVGWYLPYSRLLSRSVVNAWWFDKRTRDGAVGQTFPEMLVNEPRTLIETSLLSPFGQSLLTRRRIRKYGEFMSKARGLLDDPRVGLLLLHVPVPHTPYIYDRRTGQYTMANSVVEGYWDALALVDRTVGEIQARMTRRGEWDGAAVLVTSDHYFRTSNRLDGRSDRRVPFLLKMPGQRRALAFDKPFNTQLSHDLLLEILRGNVRTDQDAIQWLEKSHARVPVGWGILSSPAPQKGT